MGSVAQDVHLAHAAWSMWCSQHKLSLPYMKDKCTKNFPKLFIQHTQQGADSYYKYARLKSEDGGHTGIKRMKQNGAIVDQVVTNQWVVPYNPYLLRQLDCHINMDICSSIKSVKYVLKNTDKAVIQLQQTEGDWQRVTRLRCTTIPSSLAAEKPPRGSYSSPCTSIVLLLDSWLGYPPLEWPIGGLPCRECHAVCCRASTSDNSNSTFSSYAERMTFSRH